MPTSLICSIYDDSQAFRTISRYIQRDMRTVREIAEAADVSEPTVRKWMYGMVQYPRFKTVFKFCKAYRLQMRITPRRGDRVSSIRRAA